MATYSTRGWIAAAAAVATIATGTVFAQAAPGKPSGANEARMAAMWQRMDVDGDGQVSRAEFERSQQRTQEQRMKRFDEADTNGDGLLSAEEMQTWRESMRARMAGHGMQGMAAGRGMHGGGMHGGGMQRGMHEGGMRGPAHGGGHGSHGGGHGSHDSHGSHGGQTQN
jgi:hypothetical protein